MLEDNVMVSADKWLNTMCVCCVKNLPLSCQYFIFSFIPETILAFEARSKFMCEISPVCGWRLPCAALVRSSQWLTIILFSLRRKNPGF